MSLHPLLCHPAGTPPSRLEIAVAAERLDNGDLRLDYRLSSAPGTLLIPPPATPAAADDLWQHSCCEAFVAAVDSPRYREFNFSPSGLWAVYDFADYRQRNADWQPGIAPAIRFARDGGSCRLIAELPAALLPDGPLRLGLSVVAEQADTRKTYWALAHAAAQPDFHLAASFTLLLP